MTHPILLVEDDLKLAEVARVYLEQAGFRVIHTESGAGALALARTESPALVLLDLMLPDLSGEAVCRELAESSDIPVIMLTAKSSEEERLAGFALGADDYIVKPFSPRELVCRVQAVLKRTGKGDGGAERLSYPATSPRRTRLTAWCRNVRQERASARRKPTGQHNRSAFYVLQAWQMGAARF